MDDLEVDTHLACVPGDLHETTGIAGGHDARARLADALDLHPAELLGHGRLGEIVGPRAAAAQV